MFEKRALIIIILLVGTIPVYFNSCQATHYYIGEGSSFVSSNSCAIAPFFDREYRPFLKQNCANCHTLNGRGKGAFSDNDFNSAFESFNNIGHKKIGEFAVNPSHNAPFTGPHNAEIINRIETGLEKAMAEEASCGNSNLIPVDTSEWIKTRSRGINADNTLDNNYTGETTTIVWDLGRDMIAPEDSTVVVPDLQGVKISVQARIRRLEDQLFYEIYEPTVDLTDYNPSETPKNDADATNDSKLLGIRIQGLRLKVNGEYILNESTFTFIDEVVKYDEDNSHIDINNQTILSSGTMIALLNTRESDVMSVAFEKIEIIDTDPPPPPVYVSFASNGNMIVDEELAGGGVRVIPITVKISTPATQRVTVTIAADSTVDSAARPLYDGRYDNLNDTDIVGINNFDWDYKFESTRVEFSGSDVDSNGNPILEKTINMTIASDRRHEKNENIVLNITSELVSGARVANTDTTRMITISASDLDQPEYIPGSPDNNLGLFQTLFDMTDGFKDSCLHCHNNIEKNKYDLTDYNSMLVNNVLGTRVPGEAESSDMFRRLLPGDQYKDLLKMPADNGLENDFVRNLIRGWLESGGLNN